MCIKQCLSIIIFQPIASFTWNIDCIWFFLLIPHRYFNVLVQRTNIALSWSVRLIRFYLKHTFLLFKTKLLSFPRICSHRCTVKYQLLLRSRRKNWDSQNKMSSHFSSIFTLKTRTMKSSTNVGLLRSGWESREWMWQ